MRSELILIEWIQQKFFEIFQIKCDLSLSVSLALQFQQIFCCLVVLDHEVALAAESFLVEGKDKVENALDFAFGPGKDFLFLADVRYIAEVHSKRCVGWILLKNGNVGSNPFQIFQVSGLSLILFVLRWPSELSLKLILII